MKIIGSVLLAVVNVPIFACFALCVNKIGHVPFDGHIVLIQTLYLLGLLAVLVDIYYFFKVSGEKKKPKPLRVLAMVGVVLQIVVNTPVLILFKYMSNL